ncbi:hypothetical protein FHS16_005209 [Paenibacillus endophyticus]|uniref:YtkA-like domain-containing protein n=1 Tax=Paenibacillus endophyticus TaxID=1294268 RepID=A0A7W5CCC1_9BACL|nr:FixH family protein [Paenibacillus endophyticus]MBB3155102.1 hypothetical protein [Paenibacillus endophyticus]
MMAKEWVSVNKYRKGTTAAAIILLGLLATGCGSASKDEHAQHAASNQAKANDEHRNHSASGDASTAGNQGEHSGHGASDEEATAADVRLEWRYSPERPELGEKTKVELFLYDSGGKPIEKYDVNHEKLMHLIVVSEDMSEFMHIHPDYVGKGKFEVHAAFPKSGSYKLFADFIPTGSSQLTVTSTIKTAGSKEAEIPVVKDEELAKSLEGVKVTLDVSTFKSGVDVDLTFTLSDEKTKEPITDLEPYLGAIGHVVILNKDLSRYLHVHPTDDNGSGPTAQFSTSFPEPGIYKIWGQFQRGGKTFIVPFTVEAE